MVDTQRFNLGQGCVQTVSAVARELSRRNGRISVLEVTSYLPMDVESVARILESLDEMGDAEAVEEDGIVYYTLATDHLEPLDIGAADFLSRSAAFERNLATLRNDEAWTRKVRDHHELLQVIANATDATLTLAEIADKSSLSNAKVQSVLNDFASQGHIAVAIDEDRGPTYRVPSFDYPVERFERVGGKVEELESRASFRGSWIAIAIGAALILAIVIASRYI